MRQRIEIIRLANELQQAGVFYEKTLLDFVNAHGLSAGDVAQLQSELVTRLVMLFSTAQLSCTLTDNLRAPARQLSPAAPSTKVPTLQELGSGLLLEVLAHRNVYLAASPRPYRARLEGYDPGQGCSVVPLDALDTPECHPLDKLYSFPYYPMAAGQVKVGHWISYYNPAAPLLEHMARVLAVDPQSGDVLVSMDQPADNRWIKGPFVTKITPA